MDDRPNILWLTYEDTSPQFVSCYGMTGVETTPTIDELAHDGIRFDNAFATAPVCSPSRTAIITGVCNQSTGLGHHRSKYDLPMTEIRGFPTYLRDAGYYTTNNVKTDYNLREEAGFIRANWDDCSGSAHWRNRPSDAPFFSVFNYMDSHQSRTMTKPWGWYEEQVLAELAPQQIISPDEVIVPPIYRDTPQMRRHLSRVHNSLRLCDLRIGERLRELREDGLLENTIVFCFADHGEGIPRGKCNGIGFGYRAAFVLYLPERYRHCSPWKGQSATDELVSFEDLGPTVLSLAGIPVPDVMTGRAILGPQRADPPACVFAARDRLDDTPDLARSAIDGRFVYTRNYFPHLPVVKYQKYSDVGDILREIRRDYANGELDEIQAELVAPTRPIEYLYDLHADPWEVRNLADDAAYEHDLARLRSACRNHALDVRDVMFLPERQMTAVPRERTPFEARSETGYNPLEALLDAADMVGRPEMLDQQIALLEHDHEAVRYWAAVGIFASRASLGARVGRVRRRMHDRSPEVAIELAAALVDADDDEAADLLCSHITGGQPLPAHQAVSRVLYMPGKASRFAAAVDEAADLYAVHGEPIWFPVKQALEMHGYLYAGAPLYYDEDRAHLVPEERTRPW